MEVESDSSHIVGGHEIGCKFLLSLIYVENLFFPDKLNENISHVSEIF